MPTLHVSADESRGESSESDRNEGGSSDSGSSSSSDSGRTSRSFSSSNSTDDTSISGTPRRLVEGCESGMSSTPTSTSRVTSRNTPSDSRSSSSTSDSDVGEGDEDTRKNRMKNLFKNKTSEALQSEDLGELHDRVDAKLLEEVQEYDAVPSATASYGKNAFWDERYASDEEAVEWYHPWANLAPTLTQYMDEQDDVLLCGCGNSELSVDMYDDGFNSIVNADMSRVVIHQMAETYKAYPLEWRSTDLTREEFPEEKFDIALDKACLDSIVCSPHGVSNVEKYLQQMDRVLQPEGAFICVSFAPPEDRLELLEYWDIDKPDKCLAWDVHVDAVAKPALKHQGAAESDSDVFYIYVCIKDPDKVTFSSELDSRLRLEHGITVKRV